MQASDRVLARRYAQALFLSAREHNQAEQVRRELGDAYKAVAPQLAELKDPTIGAAQKKAIVRAAAPALSQVTAHFLELLIDKKRAGLLPAIVVDLVRSLDEHAGRVRAEVRCAAELSAEERQALIGRLMKFSGKDVVIETRVDPELLGGVVVRMGDTVLDASLQGKLRRLAATLVQE